MISFPALDVQIFSLNYVRVTQVWSKILPDQWDKETG